MKSLQSFIAFNSYLIAAVGIGAILLVALAWGGFTWLEALVMLAYVAGVVLLRRVLATPKEKTARFDGMTAFEGVLRGPRPTLIEFYSNNCVACMTMRPVMDRLEQEVGHRLQILRVDLYDPLGRDIARRYDVVLSPTFLLVNAAGQKEEEYTMVLDRPRVLYWLGRQPGAAA